MILGQIDENLEGHSTPLGAHWAPEGSFGGLRPKNVHFPIGKLIVFSQFFKIIFPALVRVTFPKMQKRAKEEKQIINF